MRNLWVLTLLAASPLADSQWVVHSPHASGSYRTHWGSFAFPTNTWAWEKLSGRYSHPAAAFIQIAYQAEPELRWANPSTLPPTKLYIREDSDLWMRGYFNPTLSASIPFETGRSSGWTLGYGDLTVWGHRYSQHSPSGLTLRLPATTLTAFGADSTASSLGSVYSDGSYSISILPHHWIRTDSSEWEPNYRRSASGEPMPTNPMREENLRDRDGFITLDVGGWYDAPYQKWRGYVPLDGRYFFWNNPKYTVVLTGEARPVINTQYDLEQNNPRFLLETLSAAGLEDQTLGTTSELTIAVTDGSDSTAPTLINKIRVRWHKPFENWRRLRADSEIWESTTIEVGSPGWAAYGGAVQVSWFEGGAWLANLEAAGNVIETGTVISSAIWPEFGPFFALIGLAAGQIEARPYQNNVVFNWGAPNSEYLPNRDDSLKERYVMIPDLELGYTVSYGKADHYNVNGFQGPEYKAVKRFNGGRRFTQTFVLQGGTGGGGVGGGDWEDGK
jgi:hypothetical protein